MTFQQLIDKLSKKLSHRNLIVIIVILTILILSIIGMTIKKNLFDPAQTSESSVTTQQTPEIPPMVIIDPGHGGWEPGAGKGKINEKDIVLEISLEIEKLIKEKNIDYYMIRNDDTYVSLEDRARIANEKKSKLFISIHNNSFTDPSQGGILTAYNPYSLYGEEIAKIMQSRLRVLGMRDRDIMPRPNLYVLRHTEMPSLLLEIGFMSNKKDFKLLTDSKFQKKCAAQIVSGIEEILAKITDGAGNPEVN